MLVVLFAKALPPTARAMVPLSAQATTSTQKTVVPVLRGRALELDERDQVTVRIGRPYSGQGALHETPITMIARTWHGRVPAAKADAYLAYLRRTGLPDYAATPGNRGVLVLRRTEGDVTHFVLTTLWDSLEAIRAFAGDDVTRARYYPEDDDYLLDRESLVTHYDVLMAEMAPPAPRAPEG